MVSVKLFAMYGKMEITCSTPQPGSHSETVVHVAQDYSPLLVMFGHNSIMYVITMVLLVNVKLTAKHVHTSLVPRPLPVFQCCMLKNGRAWYMIAWDSCMRLLTLA